MCSTKCRLLLYPIVSITCVVLSAGYYIYQMVRSRVY
ncbi:hypothetical protein F383_37439 [Gossypium arboreum]|uniref:Uncharacterized protein n=1 Tax=Gossypium arboreum TaxID=29729 RepID=A0A0B0MGB3_GOSAR|nr:hypothetical protein F383_37439 [Gossypium arboreum]